MSEFRFPLGLAQGEYFCNRVEETAHLLKNIQSRTHTVLIAPRRYGKTSLAYRAIEKSGLPFAKIDLYMCTSLLDIQKAILKGVNALIAEIAGVTQKLLDSLRSFVKSLKLSLEANPDGFKLSLSPSHESTPSENICEALEILDQILTKRAISAVLLIDEFQEIELIAPNRGVEGAIRHAAQGAQNFSLIFSGSQRNLLKSMFNTRNKPLYRLCDEIVLERISALDYQVFINLFAEKKWGEPISDESFDALIQLTQRHPYYANALFKSLFDPDQEQAPSPELIQMLWQDLTEKKRQDLLSETSDLTLTQKKLLVAIANGINQELTGKTFLSRSELSSSSVIKALEFLTENDFIELLNNQYRLIDPLLQTVILQLQKI